jgi:hypothetical protein
VLLVRALQSGDVSGGGNRQSRVKHTVILLHGKGLRGDERAIFAPDALGLVDKYLQLQFGEDLWDREQDMRACSGVRRCVGSGRQAGSRTDSCKERGTYRRGRARRRLLVCGMGCPRGNRPAVERSANGTSPRTERGPVGHAHVRVAQSGVGQILRGDGRGTRSNRSYSAEKWSREKIPAVSNAMSQQR